MTAGSPDGSHTGHACSFCHIPYYAYNFAIFAGRVVSVAILALCFQDSLGAFF